MLSLWSMPFTETCINFAYALLNPASLTLLLFIVLLAGVCFALVCCVYVWDTVFRNNLIHVTPSSEIEWGRRIEEGIYLILSLFSTNFPIIPYLLTFTSNIGGKDHLLRSAGPVCVLMVSVLPLSFSSFAYCINLLFYQEV